MPDSNVTSILACVALSPRLEAVAREAHRYARIYGAQLTFLYAGSDPGEQASLRARLGAAGIADARVVSIDDDPADAAMRLSDEVDADIVVLGALERDNSLPFLAGSVARRIARQVPCSVLLLTEPQTDPQPHSLIVVTAGAGGVDSRLDFAADLAQRDGATLRVLQERGPGEVPDPAALAMARSRVADSLSRVGATRLRVDFDSAAGHEGFGAAEHARESGADLLIYPAPPRRLTIWDRFFQAPIERALERLPCALLLHRP